MFNKKYIPREKYIEQIVPYIDKDMVKVILWQRRTGKSYLLLMIIDYLLTEKWISEDEIIYINKESIERDDVRNYQDLNKAIEKHRYIFIDEIQEIDERERSIASIKETWNHDIYITWSNAELLESEIATLLWWRYIKFIVYPLDYKEFLMFHKLPDDESSLITYMRYWGMPLLTWLDLQQETEKYMEWMYDSIVLRDIVQRNNLRNTALLDSLLVYLAKHVSSLFSANNISKYLKNENIKLSPNIIIEWIKHSQQAFLLQWIRRYDIKWKEIISTKQKYYFTDIWLRNYIAWWFDAKNDIEKILENLIYSHLVSHNYDILIGEFEDKEVDFIAQKWKEKIYVQVSYHIWSEKTEQREFSALEKIRDNYRKIVVTMDKIFEWSYEGIEHMHLQTFLQSIT